MFRHRAIGLCFATRILNSHIPALGNSPAALRSKSVDSDDFDMRKFKFFALICGLFFVSCWTSWEEFSYLAWGKVTDGTVTQLHHRKDGLVVEFHYSNPDGRLEQARDNAWDSTDVPREGGTIEIQYIPGTQGSARLAGQELTGMVVFFFVCLGTMLFFAYRLWRTAHDAVHGGPRRAGSRR